MRKAPEPFPHPMRTKWFAAAHAVLLFKFVADALNRRSSGWSGESSVVMAGRGRSHGVAAARARYLGEEAVSARYAVGSNRSAVIDECSTAQQSVRALLALLALNYMVLETYRFNHTPAAPIISYSFHVSPRREALVIVSRAPDNIGRRLLDAHMGFRFAGDAMNADGSRTYCLDHVSFKTSVFSTSDAGTLQGAQIAERSENEPPFHEHGLGLAPSREESEAAAYIDRLDADARVLLAALFVRLAASDRRTWAVGEFWWDPLSRPYWRNRRDARGERRSLRNDGKDWTLRWDGPPFPRDVVAALTDPVCGLRGATAHSQGREYEIVFGSARLLLRPF